MADERPCSATRGPKNALETIHGLIAEMMDLDVTEIREVVVPMMAVLQVGTTTSSDKYTIPGDHMLLIHEIRGHLLMKSMTSETVAITGIGNPSFLDRVAMKAMNCKVGLVQNESKLDILGDTNENTLGMLVGLPGSRPLKFDKVPQKVLRGNTLLMTCELVDTTASIVGGATEYGLAIIGTLVKVRERT